MTWIKTFEANTPEYQFEMREEADELNSMKERMEKWNHYAAACVCISAFARLQGFQTRKDDPHGEDPLEAGEQFEYANLLRWWQTFGIDNQARLLNMMRDLAAGVWEMGGLF